VANLTRDQRDALPADHFAVPGKRKLPIHDATHTKLAWDMVDRTKDLSDEERHAARKHIIRRAHELGVDTAEWHAQVVFQFEAMAIDVPEVAGHPNKAPFKGVLTRVDRPSDGAPGGAMGKRVLIPAAVAEAAIPSLLAMGVDCDPDGKFDSHDPKHKIGVITGAEVNGDALEIEGFFYAGDFPELWTKIQAEKHRLGFSYEIKVRIRDLDADIWVVDGCVFTGAALLYKHLAAYQTTSLAAQVDKDYSMTPEELKKLNDSIAALSTGLAAVAKEVTEIKAGKGASLAGPIIDQVEPHVRGINTCAAAMESAGIGDHPTRGHVRALRHVAAHMVAAAVAGHIPHIYRDHDYLENSSVEAQRSSEAALKAAAEGATAKLEPQIKTLTDALAGITTQLADLKAAAVKTAEAPDRKTITPEVTALLSKLGLNAEADKEKLTVANIDKTLEAAGIKGTQAMAAKLKIRQAGLLAA
jgi:hypothetical protein